MTTSYEPDDISGAMREIWDLNKPRVTGDILLVSRIVRALGDLQHAREAAHRLAGGLGVFGMNEAEHSARCIENLLAKTQNEVGKEVGDALFLIEQLEQEISTFDAKH